MGWYCRYVRDCIIVVAGESGLCDYDLLVGGVFLYTESRTHTEESEREREGGEGVSGRRGGWGGGVLC